MDAPSRKIDLPGLYTISSISQGLFIEIKLWRYIKGCVESGTISCNQVNLHSTNKTANTDLAGQIEIPPASRNPTVRRDPVVYFHESIVINGEPYTPQFYQEQLIGILNLAENKS